MKDAKMKTIMTRSLFFASVAIATLAVSAPNVSLADGKGASKLMFGPANTLATAGAPINPTMSCPRCKDAYTRVMETSSKGARSEASRTVATHMCPTCSTKITSSGAGKAKTDTVVHSCGMATSCCVATK